MKIIGMHPLSSYSRSRMIGSQVVAVVRGITNVGSVRDLIFPNTHNPSVQIPRAGTPLPRSKLRLW